MSFARELPIMSASRPQRAFTLVELLVVIGIIAVLIGIILPALARARESAESVQCMSNLRQIGGAMVIYVNQSNGWLPVAPMSGSPGAYHFMISVIWWPQKSGPVSWLPLMHQGAAVPSRTVPSAYCSA